MGTCKILALYLVPWAFQALPSSAHSPVLMPKQLSKRRQYHRTSSLHIRLPRLNNRESRRTSLTSARYLRVMVKPLIGYKRPSHSIFPYLPNSWVPYAELMRLDRQAGFWAFYWHYLIGLGFAVNIPPFSYDLSLIAVVRLAAHLALWTTLFRGITCTWNDNLDQDFDRQVARCRVRPIPRGAVSTFQAHVFTVAQTVVGAAILYPLINAGGDSTLLFHALVGGVLLFIYPLLKRCTYYPQVELGFGLSYAIFMVTAALGKDPLAPLLTGKELKLSTALTAPIVQSSLYLYFAGIIWTVIFDTIYAHQDYLDDLKAGVMGLAVLLGRKGTKPACYIATGVQVYFLILAGQLADFGMYYFLISCGATGLVLTWMIWVTDLEDGRSCAWAFGRGSGYVGTAMTVGFAADFVAKKYGL
ncbi:putative 4-hydroxybenzoate polyprenyl protein [Naviculisporaceae sp. PSN 640]